ncbi:MAG: ketosteroid isomerase-like protein [Flavobacteriales bacterium]|jgi:ketosteroid isomerase-like protein
MKPIIALGLIITLFVSCKETKQPIDIVAEKTEVLSTMKSYKEALQNLTTDGTFELFTDNAKVFEQGKAEGTYQNYINHHLGPELGHFKSFQFSNYEIEVTVNSPYAFTTETYNYTIILKANEEKETEERIIESKGIATSVLKKENGMWKIINSHSSFKKL